MTEQTTPAAAPKTRYFGAAETAKLLRPVLKRTFPGVKFSVRSSNYSMGCSVDVSWTDGPTRDAVEAVTHGFKGTRFEGMTDCAYSANSWYCVEHGARVAETYGCDVSSNNDVHASRCCAKAELLHFLPSTTPTRYLSEDFREELAVQVRKECGMPADAPVDAWLPANSCWQYNGNDTVRDGVYRLSVTTAR